MKNGLEFLRRFFRTFFVRDPDPAGSDAEWYKRLEEHGQSELSERWRGCCERVRSLDFEELRLKRKGVELYGRLYGPKDHELVFVLVHGFHSSSERDLGPMLEWIVRNGWAALAIDQRCHGKSGGRYITYGIEERYDVLGWCRLLKQRGEKNVYLWGVSMGCASSLMAAAADEEGLVRGTVADCGYSSMKTAFYESMKRHGYGELYPMMRLACRLKCRFDPSRLDVKEHAERISSPVLFVHGDCDRLVSKEHTLRNHAACPAKKELLIVKGAGHGTSFAFDPEGYKAAVAAFVRG